MTNKAYILSELERLVERNDEEEHRYADALLCELLIRDGHQDVVDLYNKLPKWYD